MKGVGSENESAKILRLYIRGLVLLSIFALLPACAPSETAIQTAIAETAEAQPTETPIPTATTLPTVAPSPTPDCAALTLPVLAEIEPLLMEWDDALSLASSTARINLSAPVSELQSIRRDVDNITFPPCAQWRQQVILDYMNASIDSFVDFMQEKETSSDFNAELSSAYLEGLGRAMDPSKDQFDPPQTVTYLALITDLSTIYYYNARGETVANRSSGIWAQTLEGFSDHEMAGVRLQQESASFQCMIIVNGALYAEALGGDDITCGREIE